MANSTSERKCLYFLLKPSSQSIPNLKHYLSKQFTLPENERKRKRKKNVVHNYHQLNKSILNKFNISVKFSTNLSNSHYQ